MTSSNSVRGLESGKRAAVVVHEWQRGTVDPACTGIPGLAALAESLDATQNINRVTQAARAAGMPVFWSMIEPRPDRVGTFGNSVLTVGLLRGSMESGSAQAELHPGIETDPDRDIWIRRAHGLTPFHGTELESFLRERRIDTIVLCGVSVDCGVPGAAIEAVNRGFSVVAPRDCIAGSSREVYEYMVPNQLQLVATISDAVSVVAAMATLFATSTE